MCAWDVSLFAPWESTDQSHDVFVLHLQSVGCTIIGFVGFHLEMTKTDLMYATLLGFAHHLCGGILCRLILENQVWRSPTHGAWQRQRNYQSKKAVVAFRTWCKLNHVACNHTVFTCNSLSMHKLSDAPCLEAEAANTLCIMRWLSELCCANANNEFQ